MAVHPNDPIVTNIRGLLHDLEVSPSRGTVINIVDKFEAGGGELPLEEMELYQKMIDNPDDKNIEIETVNRVRGVLEGILAAILAEGGRRRSRRRATKKRKALTKRSTRKR
jgi:hypothetical protein